MWEAARLSAKRTQVSDSGDSECGPGVLPREKHQDLPCDGSACAQEKQNNAVREEHCTVTSVHVPPVCFWSVFMFQSNLGAPYIPMYDGVSSLGNGS
jgi:hypothetical protein